ncbi:UNVERIFIED_CONTAM: hypothetical protein Sindi_1651400 [Sesamum indicum]
MKTPNNPSNKQKTVEVSGNNQPLQVVVGASLTPVGGSTPTFPTPLLILQGEIPPLTPHQMVILVHVRLALVLEASSFQEGTKGTLLREGVAGLPPVNPPEVPQQWLARFECFHKGIQDVQHQIAGIPGEELQGVPFTNVVMANELPANCCTPAIAEYDGLTDPQEHLLRFKNVALLHRYTDGIMRLCSNGRFKQLPPRAIGSFQEFRSMFLQQFASSRKLQKMELSLFAVRKRDNEPLREYLQRFNAAAPEPSLNVS